MLDFLFGTKQAAQDSTTQIKLPEYMERAAESLVATAGDVAKEDFIPYTGPRLAGMSDLENKQLNKRKLKEALDKCNKVKHTQQRPQRGHPH